MAANLSGESFRVFRCPKCHEFVNTTMKECRFCGSTIDPAAAKTAVEVQTTVNSICNDASYARVMAGTMWVFFFLSLIPLLGLMSYASYILFLLVPFPLARSWWRMRAMAKTEEPAFKNASGYIRAATLMWVPMFLVMALGLIGTIMRR
jgi:hypothetical protein